MVNVVLMMESERAFLLSTKWVLIVAVLVFCIVGGCRKGPVKGEGTIRPDVGNSGLMSQEILEKVSDLVLAGVPDTELMKDIRKRGVLRVELPAGEFPFQYMMDGRPAGFNVDLVYEIGRVLNVKPNVEIGRGEMRGMEELDFFVYRSKEGGEGPIGGIPFFFLGEEEGWLAIYVAGGDEGLTEAIERILDYLEETGIFARLYRRYFYEQG